MDIILKKACAQNFAHIPILLIDDPKLCPKQLSGVKSQAQANINYIHLTALEFY